MFIITDYGKELIGTGKSWVLQLSQKCNWVKKTVTLSKKELNKSLEYLFCGESAFVKNSVVYYHHSYTTGGREWREMDNDDKWKEIEELKKMFENIRVEVKLKIC